jgi:hypothetical protein
VNFEIEWARCAPFIEGALAHAGGTHTLADVKEMVLQREARFWAGRRAALITCIEEYPRTRWLLLWLAGGDLAELTEQLRPAAEAYGRREGCRRVVIIGRPGWERRLTDYSPIARVIAKEL